MNEIYYEWLQHPSLDETLKEELKAMDENAIEEAFYQPIAFGTGGIRGIVGAGSNRMNVHTVASAAKAFADALPFFAKDYKERGVVIAYDTRHKSQTFAETCAKVLGANNIKTMMFENVRPTPILSFAVRHCNAAGGIMVTASHNPKEYNGVKMYDDQGVQLTSEKVSRVARNMDGIHDMLAIAMMPLETMQKSGLYSALSRDVDNAYLKRVAGVQFEGKRKRDIKVVFTPMHGASREIALRALLENGYHVIPVDEQMVADPNFSTAASPNPEEASAYTLALDYARREAADLVIATDPDGDRIGVAVRTASDYRILNGNQLGALFIDYVCKNRISQQTMPEKPVLIDTIVSGPLARKIAEDYGVRTESTLTGFRYIGERMTALEKRAETFVMAYEESHGFVIDDVVRDKDGMQAMMLVAELADVCKREGMTLVDKLHQLYEKHGAVKTSQMSIERQGKRGKKTIEHIMDTFRSQKGETFFQESIIAVEDYLARKVFHNGKTSPLHLPVANVLKFVFNNGWCVLRPSGTEPKLKVYFAASADSLTAAETIITAMHSSLSEHIEQIENTMDKEVST